MKNSKEESYLREEFRAIKPDLERLRTALIENLSELIDKANIPIFAIESRIKDEDSLIEKISRKKYEDLLNNVSDLCGIRIICYYQADIEKICEIIDKELHIVDKEDKQDSLAEDRFGYRSLHYVVSLKDEWLSYPTARGLKDFKSEVQVRTMLMHTWSAISHKLLYKREEDVPPQFRRRLNRLSALIELADEQFDLIKDEKSDYTLDLRISPPLTEIELNSDMLISIWEKYFPDRKNSDKEIPHLLNEIREAGVSGLELIKNIERVQPILKEMESYEAEQSKSKTLKWTFSGAIRTVLDLTCDKYFNRRCMTFPENHLKSAVEFRHRLKEIEASRN